MSEPRLSDFPFQHKATDRVRQLLKDKKVQVDSVKMMVANEELSSILRSPEQQVAVHVSGPKVDIELYDDTTIFVVANREARLELPDYPSEDALLEDFLAQLEEALKEL